MAFNNSYFTFVERDENMPEKVDLPMFLDELSHVDALKMGKAFRWVQAQIGFDLWELVATFLDKLFGANSLKKYLVMVKSCSIEVPGFEAMLTSKLLDMVCFWFGRCHNPVFYTSLLKASDLANELHSNEISSSEFLYQFMCFTMKGEIGHHRRTEMMKKLLAGNAIEQLKRNQVDKKFASFIGILKWKIMHKCSSSRKAKSVKELDRISKSLIDMNFLPLDALQYDKMDKFDNILNRYCNESCNLKKTLYDLAALKCDNCEELTQFILIMLSQAIRYGKSQQKLGLLQVHLRNQTLKDQKDLFDKELEEILLESLIEPFATEETAEFHTNMHTILYLCVLFNNDLIKHNLITQIFDHFIALPARIGDIRFAEMFPSVEDKLKAEIGEEDFQRYFDHMMDKIVRGKDKLPELQCISQQWLKKVVQKRKQEANRAKWQLMKNELKKSSKVHNGSGKPANIDELLDGYCQGVNNLEQTLEYFEMFKEVSEGCLGFMAEEFLNFALSKTDETLSIYKSLAALLKSLSNETFSQRSDELIQANFQVLQRHINKFLRYTTEEAFERNMSFVRYLSQLYMTDVINEVLVVESLESMMSDCGSPGKKCFIELFFKTMMKLGPISSEEKFDEYESHMEDEFEEDLRSITKIMGAVSVQSKKVPMQKIAINLYDLEGPEKLKQIVANLRKVLNTEIRMEIFVKHMLERSKSDIKKILMQAKLLVELAKASDESFEFKSLLTNTIQSEYLRTNSIVKFDDKAKAKLNRIELISGELWRNNLMGTKRFAGLLMSKKMRLLPTESLAHLSMIVGSAIHSEGNSKLKLAVRTFEAYIFKSTIKEWSDLNDDLEEVGTELLTLLSLGIVLKSNFY